MMHRHHGDMGGDEGTNIELPHFTSADEASSCPFYHYVNNTLVLPVIPEPLDMLEPD